MVDYTALTIRQDEGSPYWTCRMELADPNDIWLFPLDAAFAVDFYGTVYRFVVDGASGENAMTNEGGRPVVRRSATVNGASPLILQSGSRATTITYEQSTNMLASQIVTDLIGPVAWNLLDWAIPARRFAVEGVSPVDAARQVADAVGGMLRCQPNGDVEVRPRYPIRVPDYHTIAPTLEVSGGAVHRWAMRGYTPGRWDTVTVRDVEPDDKADTIEFVKSDIDPLGGTLRAYPRPWRTGLSVTSSRFGWSISGGVTTTRAETERVEFVAGRAQMRYPIYSINSVDWLDKSLGGVSFDQHGRELRSATEGAGYAEISYDVRSINFSVQADVPQGGQLRLAE